MQSNKIHKYAKTLNTLVLSLAVVLQGNASGQSRAASTVSAEKSVSTGEIVLSQFPTIGQM